MSAARYTLQSHDHYGQIEDDLQSVLDESLTPHGPDVLYDLVAHLGISAGSAAVDVGCGEGRHAIELATRFELDVHGLDPLERHVEIARQQLAAAAGLDSGLADRVHFALGVAADVPLRDCTVDFIWCRDVLSLVDDLPAAYTEFQRILKPGGKVLVYQMFATDRLEPHEAGWLLPTMDCVPQNMRPERTEAAIRAVGLRIDECIEIGTEWGEYDQEQSGRGGRKLLHAARLLRHPHRYIERFGQANYDIALGDCLWHVYRMIGKLSGRAYLLSSSD